VRLGAALAQSGTENLSGLTTLLIYLVPAGIALGLVIAAVLRRRRRAKRDER